jgi:hypothetical protein
MLFIDFEEYEKRAREIAEKPFNGRFSGSGKTTYKRHPGQIWRPISWCDKCKADISGGVVCDEELKVALCPACSDLDKKIASSLGIIIE